MRRAAAGVLVLLGLALPAAAAPPRLRPRASAPKVPPLLLPAGASDRDRAVGEACQRALGARAGAVVAMDPNTGRVIAIVNPEYGLFTAVTPCSVFKIVVSIAGLSEGLITPQTLYNCRHGCYRPRGHGPIDLRRALAVSCNPYFEDVGARLGYATLQRYAALLGLGEVSGINLTGEAKGELPESVPASAVGHMSSHATGIAASVVQIAVLLSAVVNGGTVLQPRLAPGEDFVPKERWRLPAGIVLDGLADGFLGAVNEGTATPAHARAPDVALAGKTGSCEHHGWFASYALASKPEIVVVVYMQTGNGPRASGIAGRIYRDIYKSGPPQASPAAATSAAAR